MQQLVTRSYYLFGTGLLGAFTTMSAFAVDSIRLAENNPSSTLIMITTTILGSIAFGLVWLALFDIHNCMIQQELLITNVEVHIRLALVGHSDAAKGELRNVLSALWYSRVHVTQTITSDVLITNVDTKDHLVARMEKVRNSPIR